MILFASSSSVSSLTFSSSSSTSCYISSNLFYVEVPICDLNFFMRFSFSFNSSRSKSVSSVSYR